MSAEVQIIEMQQTHPLFEELCELRQTILRYPLGMKFTPEELAVNDGEINLAACEDGRVLGSLLLRPTDAETLEIKRMAVAESQQGRGTGRRLVEHGESLALQRGIRHMIMEARIIAQPFYERLGYKTEGNEFVKSTIPHIVMKKTLVA